MTLDDTARRMVAEIAASDGKDPQPFLVLADYCEEHGWQEHADWLRFEVLQDVEGSKTYLSVVTLDFAEVMWDRMRELFNLDPDTLLIYCGPPLPREVRASFGKNFSRRMLARYRRLVKEREHVKS